MRSLGIATIASGLAIAFAAPAMAADSGGEQARAGRMGMQRSHMPRPQMHRPQMHRPQLNKPHMGGRHHAWTGRSRWGHRTNGRWHAGWSAPGGWNGYRFAYSGYQLPSYWIAPTYYLSYQTYGLPAPRAGYQWSRYYDDAVMIDRDGRVIDARRGIDWDRYEGGYDDSDYPYSDDEGYARRGDGAGGAVAGAVVGGVAGNLIGGRGNRLAGTLLGAGVGAAAGYAIDRAEDQRRGPPPGYDGPPPGHDGPPPGYDGPPPGYDGPPPPRVREVHIRERRLPPPGDYGWNEEVVASGSWNGTWTGRYDDGRPYRYQGSFDGQYRGDAPRAAGASYPMPHAPRPPHHALPHAPMHNPAIVPAGGHVIINGMSYPAGGTVVNGYYYPPATTTTITVQTQPVTTSHTVVTPAPRRPAHRRWRAPAKPRCAC